MENVHWFYWSQQGLSEGWISISKDRFSGRRSSFVIAHEFTRLLFRLPSNLDEERRRAKNQLHHPQWYILLPSDAWGAQECWRKLQQNDSKGPSFSDRQKRANICRWYHSKKHVARKSHCRLARNICQLQEGWPQAKSRKMCFRSEEGQVSWLPDIDKGYWS